MKASLHLKSCEHCESRENGIFCDLEKQPLGEIGKNKVTNTYKKGQIIFHQGNPPYGLYCINSGKIKLTRSGHEGKESIIRLASAGDVLGHRSLFNNENYSATATVMEDATICFLDKKFIIEVIQKEPSVALQLIQKLSRDMGAAEAKSAALVQKSVRERLAEFLLAMKTSFGVKLPDGRTTLDIKITREEMASMIGTSNETVIRFMSEFKTEGLIEQEGKTIIIKDEEALLELAQLNF